MSRQLYPRERAQVPKEQEAVSTQAIWTFWRRGRAVVSAGIPTPDRSPHSLVTTLKVFQDDHTTDVAHFLHA